VINQYGKNRDRADPGHAMCTAEYTGKPADLEEYKIDEHGIHFQALIVLKRDSG
jgi:hypothetical protein